jgi:hypothetical protein
MAGEQTIDELNIKINAEAKQSSSGLDKLVSSIERLKAATGGGVGQLTGIAVSLHTLTSILSNMKSQSGIVSSLANSIQKLNDAKTDRISGSISTLTASLKTLGGMDPTLKTMISDLATLAKSGTGGVSGNALTLEAAAAKAQATIDQSALKSAKAQEGLKAIADKNKQIEETARQAAQYEKELLDTYNEAKTATRGNIPAGTADLGAVMPDYTEEAPVLTQAALNSHGAPYRIEDSVNSLKAAIGETGSTAANAMGKVSAGSSRAASFMDKLKQSVNDVKDKLSSLGNTSNSFFSMGRFYGWYFILRQIASVFGGFINNINSFIENQNLFNVAMGKSAQSGRQLADSLQSVLGVDSGEAMRYMGIFGQLTTSFGIANKQAMLMSENMTQLGYDIASFYNISTEKAFSKLQSGITGQVRAIRELGIDTSNARLQQELYNLGINEKVRNLTEADKAELRYIAIMKQTTNAQGDMARTIQTPANALRVLQAQFVIAGRAIGSIFIPALEAILPVVTAAVEVIGDLASELAAFFGFQMPKIDYSSLKDITNGADDASDAVSGVGDSAAKSKKQLDNLIGGFDELHIAQKDSGEGEGGAAGAGGNLLSGIDLPSYDALADAAKSNIESIKEQLEKYIPLIKEILKTVAEIGAAFLAWKLSSDLFNGLMTIFPHLKDFRAGLGEAAAGLAVVAGLFAFAYLHSENFRKGLQVLGEGIKWVGEKIAKFASGVAKSLGIKELSGEFWTANASIIVIAIGLIAAALGAPVFGTILVVGGMVALAIQGIGYAASDSIEPVNLFGEGISSTTEKKLKPFLEQTKKLDETIKGLKWSGKIITDADVDSVKLQVKKIVDALIGGLDADKNQALKNLNPLKNLLDSKTYDDILKKSGQYYDQQKKSVQQGEDQINKIMQAAKDQHRGLTQEEYDEITKIESNMQSTGIKNLSASATESHLIFQRLKDNHTALSAQEASEIVKNSAKQRDTTIDDAKKQYDGIMTEAQRMYDVGAINKDQYDQIRDAAEKSKDDTISQAQEQHTKIVEEAKKQAGELSYQVDWSTGDIKSKWQSYWDWYLKTAKTNWGEFFDFFKVSVPQWWNETIAPWFTKERWHAIGDNMKAGITDKWNETVAWWNTLGPIVWWNESVAPWFSADKWNTLGQGAMNGLWNGLKSVWDGIKSWFSSLKFPHLDFEWHDLSEYDPDIASGLKKFGIKAGWPEFNISWYANGAAFYGKDVIGVGEYSGAQSNPEVVAPQSIIRATVEESNGNVVAVLSRILDVAEKIAEKDTTVNLDGEKISENTNKRNASRGYNLGLQST